jgi:hypothetical protein
VVARASPAGALLALAWALTNTNTNPRTNGGAMHPQSRRRRTRSGVCVPSEQHRRACASWRRNVELASSARWSPADHALALELGLARNERRHG